MSKTAKGQSLPRKGSHKRSRAVSRNEEQQSDGPQKLDDLVGSAPDDAGDITIRSIPLTGEENSDGEEASIEGDKLGAPKKLVNGLSNPVSIESNTGNNLMAKMAKLQDRDTFAPAGKQTRVNERVDARFRTSQTKTQVFGEEEGNSDASGDETQSIDSKLIAITDSDTLRSMSKEDREKSINANKLKLVAIGCFTIFIEFPLIRNRSSTSEGAIWQLLLEILTTVFLENMCLAMVWLYYMPAGEERHRTFRKYVAPGLVGTSLILIILRFAVSPNQFYDQTRNTRLATDATGTCGLVKTPAPANRKVNHPLKCLPKGCGYGGECGTEGYCAKRCVGYSLGDHPTVYMTAIYYSIVLPWRFLGLGWWCQPDPTTNLEMYQMSVPGWWTPYAIIIAAVPPSICFYVGQTLNWDIELLFFVLFAITWMIMIDVGVRLCTHGREVEFEYSHGHAIVLGFAVAAFPSGAGTMMMGTFVSFKGSGALQMAVVIFWDFFVYMLRKVWAILGEWSLCRNTNSDSSSGNFSRKDFQNACMVSMVIQITDDLYQKLLFVSLNPREAMFWVLFVFMLTRDMIKYTSLYKRAKKSFITMVCKCGCFLGKKERDEEQTRERELKKARKWIWFKCMTSQKMFSDIGCIFFVTFALILDIFWGEIGFGQDILSVSAKNPDGIARSDRFIVVLAYIAMLVLKYGIQKGAGMYLENRTEYIDRKLTKMDNKDTISRVETGQSRRTTLANAKKHMNDEVVLWEESFWFFALTICYMISIAFSELEFVWSVGAS